MGGLIPAIAILAALVVIPLGIVAMIYLVVPVCRGIVWLVSRVFKFTFGEVSDILRFIGAAVTFLVFVPLVIGNIIIGRWSAAGHFGRAIQSECYTIGRCVYRIVVGHPARLLCLTSLVEGIEHRVPAAVAAAPGADAPRGMGDKLGGSGGGGRGGRTGQFDGYRIVGSLPGGGSGSKLYIAAPNAQRLAAFARNGQADVGEVVIKSFSLRDGSTLPQIVRESRALDAAKRLGLILEHDLTPERFYYVMRYVPGESLGLVTQRLHGAGEGSGLGRRELAQALDYAADLLRTLTHYHSGGLWHKDVKPDNIIISRDGQAHLVDFGLVTPLRSAMTLTTHGTEYFRDPEMVRMALKGVKVQDVDGTKFDVYAAGAVLYSIIENSFPAHGGLSQISKPCPEALRWIVRRAMTDYDKRYESAAAMLADVEAVAAAADPFAMLPVALPSVRGGEGETPVETDQVGVGAAPVGAGVAAAAVAASPVPPPAPPPPPPPPPPPAAGGSQIRVTNWWTGRYAVARPPAARAAAGVGGMQGPAPAPFRRHETGRTAAEQLRHARERAAAARARAQQRMRGRGHAPVYASAADQTGVNGGVALALAAFIALCALIGAGVYGLSYRTAPAGASQLVHADLSADGALASVQLVDTVPGAAAPEDGAPGRDLGAGEDAAEPQGQVLVIRDSFTLGPEIIGRVNSALARMGKAGFELIGNVAGKGGEGGAADADTQIEMAADLRNELGLLPFRSTDAQTVIQSWLSSHDEVSLVTWIGTGDQGQPIAWVVGRDRAAKPAVSRAMAALTGR